MNRLACILAAILYGHFVLAETYDDPELAQRARDRVRDRVRDREAQKTFLYAPPTPRSSGNNIYEQGRYDLKYAASSRPWRDATADNPFSIKPREELFSWNSVTKTSGYGVAGFQIMQYYTLYKDFYGSDPASYFGDPRTVTHAPTGTTFACQIECVIEALPGDRFRVRFPTLEKMSPAQREQNAGLETVVITGGSKAVAVVIEQFASSDAGQFRTVYVNSNETRTYSHGLPATVGTNGPSLTSETAGLTHTLADGSKVECTKACFVRNGADGGVTVEFENISKDVPSGPDIAGGMVTVTSSDGRTSPLAVSVLRKGADSAPSYVTESIAPGGALIMVNGVKSTEKPATFASGTPVTVQVISGKAIYGESKGVQLEGGSFDTNQSFVMSDDDRVVTFHNGDEIKIGGTTFKCEATVCQVAYDNDTKTFRARYNAPPNGETGMTMRSDSSAEPAKISMVAFNFFTGKDMGASNNLTLMGGESATASGHSPPRVQVVTTVPGIQVAMADSDGLGDGDDAPAVPSQSITAGVSGFVLPVVSNNDLNASGQSVALGSGLGSIGAWPAMVFSADIYPSVGALVAHTLSTAGALSSFSQAETGSPINTGSASALSVCTISQCTEPSIVRWGTWADGSASLDGIISINPTSTAPLHYLIGSATDPAVIASRSGTVTFNHIGGTAPTGADGTIYSATVGSMSINFTTPASSSLSLYRVTPVSGVSTTTYQFTNVPLTFSTSTTSGGRSFSQITINGPGVATNNGVLDVGGVFLGPNGTHIGAGFVVKDSTNAAVKINSTQAFKQQ